jgi:type IV secretion system protein VirB9
MTTKSALTVAALLSFYGSALAQTVQPTPKSDIGAIPLHQAIDSLKQQQTSSGDPVPSIHDVRMQQRQVARSREEPLPASFQPVLSVPMSPTAMAGVAISAKAMTESNVPVVDKEGRAIYAFGSGLPTLVCAPLRVCTLELQMGEKILGEPQLGDSSRWIITPQTSGTDVATIPVLVIKPKASGLDTTMVILTDRRTYYVRLISEPEEFMARTAFTYADDEHVQWSIFLQRQAKEQAAHNAESHTATVASLDNFHFNYKIEGKGDESFRPVRVMDDGAKTYIQMPDAAMHQDLPTLVVVNAGKNEMVNFRVQNNTYIVDRIFTHGALLIGTGKKQQRFDFNRETGS